MADEPTIDPDDPLHQPLPEGGWSERLVTLVDAIAVPPVESAFVQEAGVLYSDRSYCAEGALWRKYRPITTSPNPAVEVTTTLKGRWLWGGVLWAHFGHFLVESSARLWALDQIQREVDGVLFIPKRPAVGDAVRDFQRDFIHLMAPDLPIRVATEPTQVDELLVPGQGFGLGKITQGTDSFRNAIHNRFARDIAADGPDKLYISRSALGLNKGGLLGEERLEQHLQDEGYEIFHPEKYDLATQLARYKAARKVIAADGSALHLYAMVGRPDQDVAMILRRKAGKTNLLADNVQHFCGRAPLIVDALHTEWVRSGKGKSNRLSFGELNHRLIAQALAGGGFIRADATWPELTEAERKELFDEKGLGATGDFVESPEYAVRRIRRERRERRARREAAKSNT